MARKLPGLPRILPGDVIAAIVYAEISSSLYFALGVVSLWALSLTPLVLLGVGLLFAVAATAYAEGVTTYGEAGGASGLARRAFGDLAGFVVAWAVLLDFIVVAALSLLFVPHYAFAAVGELDRMSSPTDIVVASCLGVVIGLLQTRGLPRLDRIALPVAVVDLVVQVGLSLLGVALVLDVDRLTGSIDVGSAPTWSALVYSLPIALIAFTGIEVVANLIREAREPNRALERRTMGAVSATIVLYALIAAAALSTFPVRPAPGTPSGHASAVSTEWLNAPLAGVAEAIGDEMGQAVGTGLRGLVGLSAVVILLFSGSTAFFGATRLIQSLGRAKAVPPPFNRQSRKGQVTLAISAVPTVGVVVILLVARLFGDEATGLAGIYSFGILLAFMAVFLGVTWLRFTEPERPRPLKMRVNFRVGETSVPFMALVGFGLSWLLWLLALGTHRAARIVPPLWLLLGLVVYIVARRTQAVPILRSKAEVPPPPPEVTDIPYGTILVPVKAHGPIEDEMLAMACKLAAAQDAKVLALHVVEVPLARAIDEPIPDAEEEVAHWLEQSVASFASDYGVPIEARTVRSRAISSTIAEEAREVGAGLILIGAVPHYRQRAGRLEVFSETVENLLRRADTRVIVTSFPRGTTTAETDDDAAAAASPAEPAPRA